MKASKQTQKTNKKQSCDRVPKVKHRLAAALSALLVTAQLFAGTINVGTSGVIDITPAGIIKNSNLVRDGHKVPELTENNILTLAAEAKLADMRASNYWDHTSPNGKKPWDFIRETGYSYSYAGENLAKGFTDSESVVDAWMNSEKHRENLLNTHFTEIGVATGTVKLDGRDQFVTVQMFASPGQPTEANGGAIVLGVKQDTRLNLLAPTATEKLPFFLIWAILFILIVFDGIELRRCGFHKSKKHMFEFRTALLINSVAFLILFINVSAIA